MKRSNLFIIMLIIVLGITALSIDKAYAKRPYPWGTITELEHNQSKGVMYGIWHSSQDRRDHPRCDIPDSLPDFYYEVWPIVEEIMNACYGCIGVFGERGTAMANTYAVITAVYPCTRRNQK